MLWPDLPDSHPQLRSKRTLSAVCARIHARPAAASSRQVGIRVVDQELAGGIVPDESLAE